MITYERDPQQTIPESSVKIIGLGGAGANMLDRAALDGMTGAEMLCVNTDMRTLTSSVAGEKIQIGKNLTKGLGAGGDPELGLKAAQESEAEIRDALRDRQMIFLCVGLGGGTGSGAAPLISRLAREEGAFVVVFATMPFAFEGARRREQAETALNELAALANALVTFDNGRMGELVLAKQGIHEAFAAADRMISESIKAVTRLVVRPGLINVGLDDLMTALKTTRSRCLFGSGIAEGENRAQLALENSLTSPLLDKGSLLADATTVLVHVCGGKTLTLYEVELLMQALGKHIPETAHVLFGAAVDPAMGDSLSVTLVSALPEERLTSAESVDLKKRESVPFAEGAEEEEPGIGSDSAVKAAATAAVLQEEADDIMEPSEGFASGEVVEETVEEEGFSESEPVVNLTREPKEISSEDFEDDLRGEVIDDEVLEVEVLEDEIDEQHEPSLKVVDEKDSEEIDLADDQPEEANLGEEEESHLPPRRHRAEQPAQGELELDGGPKGKFEGENPNFHEGEDLDIPPFLRNKKR